MYGPISRLQELERRRAGIDGEQTYKDAIIEHQAELESQAELDEQKQQKDRAATREE
jgi:hypothetical protein